jgi:MFS family permease
VNASEADETIPVRPRGFALGNATRVFRHRNFRLWFVGQAISLAGTWMQQVAQGWLVLILTDDPFLLGITVAAQFTPVLVLGLFGGIVADALPKRPTMIATQAAQMVLALVLFGLVATDAVALWHVLLLAVLLGVVNAVDMPVRQVFTIEMVGREDVSSAIGINSATFNGARIVGPAVAGLVIGAFDIGVAFLANGLSFLAVLLALVAMRESELLPGPRVAAPRTIAEIRTSLAEGLRYVRRAEVVLVATVVVGFVSMFGMNFGVLVPAYARDVLGVDAAGFGFLMAASGVGSLVAALVIAFSGRSRTAMIGIGAVVLGIAEIAAGIVHLYPLALVAMVVVGFGAISMAATGNAAIQLHVPDALRGRVMSVYTTVFVGATPVGSLLIGALASQFGADVALLVGGTVSAVVGAAAWLRLRAPRRAAAPAPA